MRLKHEWARGFNWDCIVLDEYHYGAWRENAKELIGISEDLGSEIENPDYFDEDLIPITSRHYLYLSGTPFRAIASGEFIEEQIYNWTYSDEQREKETWGEKPDNPYASLPKMVMLTYQLPAEISRVAEEGEFDEFDLNSFFEAEGKGEDAVFKHHDEVQKWREYLHNYPPEWINGYDYTFSLRDSGSYDIRAIPSLYLLDAGKRVIMKDAPTGRVLDYLETIYRQ